MLNLLLAGALIAKALAQEDPSATPEARIPDPPAKEPLEIYSNQVAEVSSHVSNATACYDEYTKKVKAEGFGRKALLSTISVCDKEYDASQSRLRDARDTASKPGFPSDKLFGLKLPSVLNSRKDLAGWWTEVFNNDLEKMKQALENAVQVGNEQGQPLHLNPWIYPNDMKCYGDVPAPENCLGTKAFCDQQDSEAERCLQSRERPKYRTGLQADCKGGPFDSSEACVGTENWCNGRLIVRIWGSSKNCIDYRLKDGAQQLKVWQQEGSGCSEKTEACLGTLSWCALYYEEAYSSQGACFGDRHPRPQDTEKGEWRFPDASFFADSEMRNGTEALCLTIQSPETRTDCYNSRRLAPWRYPFAADCPVEGDLVDERCLGSQAWCENQTGIYGSLDGCLSSREKAPERSALTWQYGELCAERSEKCLGTDRACSLLQNPKVVEACIAARSQPGFYLPDSRSCAGQQSLSEPCIGTFGWCLNNWNNKGFTYGDEYACYAKHGFDARSFESSITEVVGKIVEDDILTVARNVTARALYRELRLKSQPRNKALESAKGDLTKFLEQTSTRLIKEGTVQRAIEKALA